MLLTRSSTPSFFSFPQTCASSGESYRLHRKTLVVNYLTIGAAPCILTRNATGLFHLHRPNQESYVSRSFDQVLVFLLQKACLISSFIANSKVAGLFVIRLFYVTLFWQKWYVLWQGKRVSHSTLTASCFSLIVANGQSRKLRLPLEACRSKSKLQKKSTWTCRRTSERDKKRSRSQWSGRYLFSIALWNYLLNYMLEIIRCVPLILGLNYWVAECWLQGERSSVVPNLRIN